MFRSIYIDGYRCLENFSISFADVNSVLILGQNGSGKSNFFDALHLLHCIAHGETLLKNLIAKADFPYGDTHKVMTFEIECDINGGFYRYLLEVEQPEHFYQPRVRKESLSREGLDLFSREGGRTTLRQNAEFILDWHHVGLPLIHVRDEEDPIAQFRRWLGRAVVISACPQNIDLVSDGEDDALARNAANLLNWIRKLLSDTPSLYTHVERFLKQVMPDLVVFRFQTLGKDEKELSLDFRSENGTTTRHDFSQLSDGEKVLFLAAGISAALQLDRPIVCFWDEPDNFIACHELSQLIMACRRAAENHAGQLVISSHNPRVVAEFSNHNTYVFFRSSHGHPTRVTRLSEMNYDLPTLVDAFERGELFR
uniref:ATPase AAA-type core domain-containing protein n=1 Tax=Desulfatirhabdium butyrativorans TaxID=340467 RepID=A0A7C4W1Y9_9BACT